MKNKTSWSYADEKSIIVIDVRGILTDESEQSLQDTIMKAVIKKYGDDYFGCVKVCLDMKNHNAQVIISRHTTNGHAIEMYQK